MTNGLSSIRIERFKSIEDAPIDLEGLNVLVGGNNSGKSSIIQGLHFAIGLLQTILLAGDWGVANSTSLNPNQLIYSPSEDAYALAPNGKLPEKKDKAISNFELTLASGKTYTILLTCVKAVIEIFLSRLRMRRSPKAGKPEKAFLSFLAGVGGHIETGKPSLRRSLIPNPRSWGRKSRSEKYSFQASHATVLECVSD